MSRPPALRARKGSALILVLMMTLAIAGLSIAAIFMSSSAGLLSAFYDKERTYRLAAESALEVVLSRLSRDTAFALPDTGVRQIGGKGLFTSELEQALQEGRVHAAIHSLKDLPTENSVGLASQGLTLGAISQREDVRDVLICPAGSTLQKLPARSLVGTSSNRRRAQLLAYRQDLRVEPIRGNVDTRIRKTQEGRYDAILLAASGVTRLGLEKHITQYLLVEMMLPAPGQGALAVQCRAANEKTLGYLQVIDPATPPRTGSSRGPTRRPGSPTAARRRSCAWAGPTAP